MPRFHHYKLPDFSTLLSGRLPRNEYGFRSEQLQIWYNNSAKKWHDTAPHKHLESDECFIVMRGELIVEVEGERFTIGPREFCCFPRGVYHSIIDVEPPYETFMIRAPSVEDKVYQKDEGKTGD
jgi:mannose-6-phosphate isomerase-like protein (cupin superfamily)